MSNPDLKLVPIEDLVKELVDRTENFVIGYTQRIDPGAPMIYVNSNGPSHLTALGLLDEVREYILWKTRSSQSTPGGAE